MSIWTGCGLAEWRMILIHPLRTRMTHYMNRGIRGFEAEGTSHLFPFFFLSSKEGLSVVNQDYSEISISHFPTLTLCHPH